MSNNIWKRIIAHVHPEKIQISLRIRAVWSESSPSAFWIAKYTKSSIRRKKTDQTARMRRLIWVYVVSTFQKVRFLTSSLLFSLFFTKVYNPVNVYMV